ncbi:MAG: glycosyltransferase family 9 protein [Saprospiraceae bacterium]
MPSKNIPQKVLIIRFSSLGDIVLTSIVVRTLKKQLNCEIHFLTKKGFKDIVASNPYIDKVWLFDQTLSDLLNELKAQRFDLIVDLQNNLRSRMIRLYLWQIPVTSYYKANFEKWLSVHFKINRLPKQHIALRYLNALKKYKVKDDGEGLDYFIPATDQVNLVELNINRPYIALVIGAAHFTKRIPVHKLQELISLIKGNYGILLIGGKAEFEIGKQLESDRVINLCGKYSINQSASLLEQSSMVIAPDTGMMHISAALKKPIRSIWGSTLPEFGFWPFYGTNHPDMNISFEVQGLTCRPCSRFGRSECPQGHFNCMEMQLITKVIKNL